MSKINTHHVSGVKNYFVTCNQVVDSVVPYFISAACISNAKQRIITLIVEIE